MNGHETQFNGEADDLSRDDLEASIGGGRQKAASRIDSAVVIAPMQWLLEDQRPEGYVQTTDLRLRAKALGIRYGEVIPRYIRRPWRALLKKAKTQGLTETECKKVAEYSIIIAYKLRKAIEVADGQ